MSQWFVIDQNGRRPVSQRQRDFWSDFRFDNEEQWPEFSHMVVKARLEHIVMALHTWGATVGLGFEDVTDSHANWDGGLWISRHGEHFVISESTHDVEDRVITLESAELLAGLMSCNAVFLGAEPDLGLVFVNTFELGQITLAWYDSETPGPSFARVFHRQGSCTEEDPRHFALRHLNMPATSPLLDRYAFVESVIGELGVEGVTPVVDPADVVSVLRICGLSQA